MGQQQQQQSGDHSMAWAWIGALVIFAGYAIWSAGKKYIVAFIFAFITMQARWISYFLHDAELDNDILLMQTLDPSQVDWEQLMMGFKKYSVVLLSRSIVTA